MSRAFRFNLILALVAVGTTLAAVAGWRFARASAPVSGPIVLVTIDALRFDRLPIYGYTQGSTPALDALAADGVVFERAYTHSPLSLPAHASLLSGRLPTATGVHDDTSAPVPDSLRLVSSMLADRGYATGGIVSSQTLSSRTGVGRGFSFFDSDFGAADDPDGTSGLKMYRDGAESERHAERWLSAAGTSRAFLFLHLGEPHSPYTPPAAFARADPYDGEVAYVDDILARLVAYLKKQQLYDESTIIVVGDHGEGLGTSGEQQHGAVIGEHTSRVPLIVKRAGNVGGGQRIAAIVQHVDLVPTILDFAKAPIPDDLPGRSLRPLLDGESFPERMVYTETLYPAIQFGAAPLRSVTDGQYRYVSGPMPALFDVTAAGEPPDVSATHSEELARFERALQELTRDAELPAPARLQTLPPDERERVLALRPGPRTLVGELSGDATPEDVDIPLLEAFSGAMTAAAQRQWTGAIDQLRALTRAHPTRADLWASLAAIAERAGRADIAIDAYRHALSLLPGEDGIRTRLASVLLRARRVDDARQQAELASRSDDAARQVEAHELLARAAVAKRDAASARLHAGKVVEIDPTSPLPSFIEGRLHFDRGQFTDALEWFEKAAEAAGGESGLSDLHWWRGEALLKLDRQEEAEAAWSLELRFAPENPRTYIALATLYVTQGRAQDAERLIARLAAWRTPEAVDAAARFWPSVGDRSRAESARSGAGRGEGDAPSPRP